MSETATATEAATEQATESASTTETQEAAETEQQQEQTFTQADVDRIVRERVQRERQKAAKTAEERIADLEQQIAASQREALRRRVQAAHGISDEDADLFLTGTDEESLTAQAKRLADRESERKKQNNVSPREGNNPTPSQDQKRDFVRSLTNGT